MGDTVVAGNAVSVAGASARAKSAAEANRSAGTAASALRTARSTDSGTAVRSCLRFGTSPVSRRAAIAWAVGPVNGGSPASISYSTLPSE